MKSCSFITSKESNQFCISARRGAHLFFSLIAVISISFASVGFAQTLSGGAGGTTNNQQGPQGGLSTVSVGVSGGGGGGGPSEGGGGGGGGVSGGNGGTGGVNVPGGLGGVNGYLAGAGGPGGAGLLDTGGGGGGGGAAGRVITTTSINSGPIDGGAGGTGGAGSPGPILGSGGGGGAGGFGAIINTAGITYTNIARILGGAGGAGGAANPSGNTFFAHGGSGGDGGVGVYLGNLTTLINSGTITGGAGGAGGAGPIGSSNASAGSSAPGVYVASGSTAIITNNYGGEISGILYGLSNGSGSLTTLTNSGNIQSLVNLDPGTNNAAIVNQSGAIFNSITNNSSGLISGFYYGIENHGTINIINNDGQITSSGVAISSSAGIFNPVNSVIGIINNNVTGVITSFSMQGISNAGQISAINNSGLIYGGTNIIAGVMAIKNNGTIGSITNTGSITAGAGLYNGIFNDGSIGTITNYGGGAISGSNGAPGVGNLGTITTVNFGGSGILTYGGTLPRYSNVIITNAIAGKLATVGTISGQTTFGISSLSSGKSAVSSTPYSAVLSGITQTQLGISGTSLSSKSNGYSYTLTETDTLNNIWDLIISGYYSGPSVANTNQSLVNTASALQGTYTLQNSVLANSFSYDCTVFGANNVCVSAGGRNTQVQAANGLNNTSALLIAAYRPHPNYRIGAYADQNLSVSNPGGTVNLGNNTPLLGLFAAWNERLDGTGTEVKVSAAYGQKNTTITRSVVGSGDGASEAGSGSSKLNSQGAQVTAKYGFSVLPEVIVSPYVGVRYTQNNMGGYTEGTSSSVTAPLTYSALNTNATTALAGVGASYRVIPDVTTFASAGVETDTNTANGTYSATNASIGTLTPINFNPNPVKTRPTATVGAYYDIEKNQRLGVTGIYRQEAYQAVSTTTVLATYTIGL
ncbi:autotransporter outer membrane beta-barrel domain-containing protein [Polynucleobacter paneuropaeus]|nr:autotransporter outer membrane beta-barrel domain-containing protein [Polynucleobacter paneuropaeus]MBT8600385.1 autotransporter outer membrane beta-barrel domain-containing protein [Polynucleobacter paneuropaeus]